MLQVIGSLALVALGMGVDALYHRQIRIAALDAYKDGYQDSMLEHVVLHDPVRGDIPLTAAKEKIELSEDFGLFTTTRCHFPSTNGFIGAPTHFPLQS